MMIPARPSPIAGDQSELDGLVDTLQSVLSRLDALGVTNGAAELDHAIHKLRQSRIPCETPPRTQH